MQYSIIKFLIEFVLTLAAVDFVSGFFHWAEDTFWDENTPIVGKWIVVPNVIHHENPAAFTEKTWWQSSWDLFLISVIIAMMAFSYNALTWHVILFCILGANANQLHKYAHMPTSNVPVLVRWLQRLRILQSARDHGAHHRGDKNMAYCVITPFLNPVLDLLGFWRGLERITVPLFGSPRREDLKRRQPEG